MKLELSISSSLSSDKLRVDVMTSCTVQELKSRVAGELGLPSAAPSTLLLFHRGRELQDSRHVLVSCGRYCGRERAKRGVCCPAVPLETVQHVGRGRS